MVTGVIFLLHPSLFCRHLLWMDGHREGRCSYEWWMRGHIKALVTTDSAGWAEWCLDRYSTTQEWESVFLAFTLDFRISAIVIHGFWSIILVTEHSSIPFLIDSFVTNQCLSFKSYIKCSSSFMGRKSAPFKSGNKHISSWSNNHFNSSAGECVLRL